jgi:hypothetical protein
MNFPLDQRSTKALLKALIVVAFLMIVLSLTANAVGLSNHASFGSKKTTLLLAGIPLALVCAVLLLAAEPQERLAFGAFVYIGTIAISAGLSAHRLQLGHNPELRWIKALLFIFGVGMFWIARLSRQETAKILRAALWYFGFVTIMVAAAVRPLGLSQDPEFQLKRLALAAFGLCAVGCAAGYSELELILPSLSRRFPERWRNRIALILLPLAIFLVNPNWPFQDIGSMDPWYYFGGFMHFARYQRLIRSYAAERLMWILPGAILAHTLSPFYGLLALHLLVYWISIFSIYFLVKTFTDGRTAMLTACLLGCYPPFIGSNGWAYVDSGSMAYFLLTLVFLVKAESSRWRRAWLALAGASCASLMFTYILWLSLVPAFVIFYYFRAHEDAVISFKALRERLVPFLTFFFLGAAGLTGCLQIIHLALYGFGRGFFFQKNLATAFVIGTRNTDPVSTGNFQWIWSAGWIVLPVLVFLLVIGLLIQNGRGAIRLAAPAKAALYVYMYVWAVAVAMTVHAGFRLLEFDYYASILIAPLFLAMGMTIFRVPESWSDGWFYTLLFVCCAICVVPLLRPDLYAAARIHGLAFSYAIGTVMMALCILFPGKKLSWVGLMCLFPIVTFALIPVQPGAAWIARYDGIGLTRRVALALRAIDRRLPADAYPAFWIDNYNSRYTGDYRGIMCSTLSHGLSMKHYPDMDADPAYRPGTFLILITERKYVFDAANEKMTDAGMPLSFYGQDLVSDRGGSFWLTYTRVMNKDSQTISGASRPPQIISVGAEGWPETLRPGSQTSEEFSLTAPEARQLFRSDIDSYTGWHINRYGSSGGLAIQPNCLSAGDRCGRYTSGDPRDHLGSDFVAAGNSASVFFSIWVKALRGDGSFRVFFQDEGYNNLAGGRELASRDDGWKLYGDWVDVRGEPKVRLVVMTSGSQPLLLDKAEILGFTGALP